MWDFFRGAFYSFFSNFEPISFPSTFWCLHRSLYHQAPSTRQRLNQKMPRGGIRRARTHQMGKSNRPRIRKLVDEMEVMQHAPTLFHSGKDQIGTFKRATKLLQAPQIERTRMGGTIVRPASRCSAERYSQVIEEHVDDHARSHFVQAEWIIKPLSGSIAWAEGEAPRACPLFSVTDDVFE